VNSTYGGVVLKANRVALEEEIKKLREQLERHKQKVRDQYIKETEKSKKELVQAFWRAVRSSPPPSLRAQIASPKPTTDEAKQYLAAMLDQAFPSVDKICDSMKINFITMDVTWETLNSPHLIDWLSKQFPVNKELKKPFEEYRAARQRISATSNVLKG
jgi:hypothetical protein